MVTYLKKKKIKQSEIDRREVILEKLKDMSSHEISTKLERNERYVH